MLKEAVEQKEESKKEEVQKYNIRGVNVNVAPSEKEFADKLFDSLAKIPTGRKAIDDMARYNVSFFLETSLGTAGGYFDPENNQIVMAKSLGMDFMEFSLVHEARHLLQNNLGRNEAESQNLDYKTRLMINRATEADAQAQAVQACKEWEAMGHTAPIKRFEKHYKPILDRFAKSNTLSDAFKGWYDDERITASYEFGYDIQPALGSLGTKPDKRPVVSLRPEDIGQFCGAYRVDGFNEFVESDHALRVHLLTKTAVGLYDAAMVAKGAHHDASIDALPVRKLKDNAGAQMYAEKYIAETRQQFASESENGKLIGKTVDAVEKINKAAVKGKKNLSAEIALAAAKEETRKLYAPKKKNLALSAAKFRITSR